MQAALRWRGAAPRPFSPMNCGEPLNPAFQVVVLRDTFGFDHCPAIHGLASNIERLDVRRIYDMHLKEFLQGLLRKNGTGFFPTDWRELLKVTDNEILADLLEAAASPAHELHTLEPYALSAPLSCLSLA